jgi:hypothetical protein
MALLLSIPTSQVGAPFAEAYAKLSHYHGYTNVVLVHVAIYASADARHILAQPVDVRSHEMLVPTEAALLPSVYEYLKTLPEYAGAVDC